MEDVAKSGPCLSQLTGLIRLIIILRPKAKPIATASWNSIPYSLLLYSRTTAKYLSVDCEPIGLLCAW